MPITKTANAISTLGKNLGKSLKTEASYLKHPLTLGIGSMSIAGGMNSVGGEVGGIVGGVGGSAVGRMVGKALPKSLSWIPMLVGGAKGYDKGSKIMNKNAPIAKRGGLPNQIPKNVQPTIPTPINSIGQTTIPEKKPGLKNSVGQPLVRTTQEN